MARKHEAVEWLRRGYTPSRIAQQMGVTVSTVMGYLYNQIGEGNIRRSDVVFVIDEKVRDIIERVVAERKAIYWSKIYRETESIGMRISKDDLMIYLKLRDARVAFGDMYEFIRNIEINLHRIVKSTLLSSYGKDWWRKGVQERIRVACAAELEKDPEPASEPYSYTNFIDLGEILEKQWNVFKEILPKKLTSNRRITIKRLVRLNHIRNSVMHPVKDIGLTDKDFAFVREIRADFNL